ncbi:hypothetical protein [Variovorax ginsengisoli]|uniref:Uncharacterized protein n=1 Tax=Variovorax ginsengisoli TaxID=363844 RepID=A0ABT9SDG3_9BURK|nr:hypothetical protein [Variovorax ginsengisoli]MDP9902384.1 hypothetical protein [Variovorax ginsengisoli]
MDDIDERRFAAWRADPREGGFSARKLALWLRSQTKCSLKVAYRSMNALPFNAGLEHLIASVRSEITRDLRTRSGLKIIMSENSLSDASRRWAQEQPRDEVRRKVVNGGMPLEGWLTRQRRKG